MIKIMLKKTYNKLLGDKINLAIDNKDKRQRLAILENGLKFYKKTLEKYMAENEMLKDAFRKADEPKEYKKKEEKQMEKEEYNCKEYIKKFMREWK